MDNVFLNIWLEANVTRHSGTLCRTSVKQATVNEGSDKSDIPAIVRIQRCCAQFYETSRTKTGLLKIKHYL